MIEVIAQATEQAPELTQQALEGITGSIQGGLGCLGAAIGVGIVGMKGAEAVGRNPDASGANSSSVYHRDGLAEAVRFLFLFPLIYNL